MQDEYVTEREVSFATGRVWISSMRWGGPTRNMWRCSHNYLTFRFTPQPRSAWISYPDSRSSIRESIGRFAFVPAGHHVESGGEKGNHRSISCYLSPELFDAVISKSSWSDNALRNGLRLNSSEVEWLLLKLHQEVFDGGFASEIMVESITSMLPVAILRQIGTDDARSRRTGGLTGWQMRRIRDRIEADLPPPNLSELADLSGISVRHLSRAFKVETGETIASHVRHTTLQRAIALLVNSQMEIGQIAASLGFSAPSSFISAFRRMTGMRPGEVRRLGANPTGRRQS